MQILALSEWSPSRLKVIWSRTCVQNIPSTSIWSCFFLDTSSLWDKLTIVLYPSLLLTVFRLSGSSLTSKDFAQETRFFVRAIRFVPWDRDRWSTSKIDRKDRGGGREEGRERAREREREGGNGRKGGRESSWGESRQTNWYSTAGQLGWNFEFMKIEKLQAKETICCWPEYFKPSRFHIIANRWVGPSLY